ncbi:hypothetical protein Hanom_Chr00s002746g01704411 [Helianthus anomalus]
MSRSATVFHQKKEPPHTTMSSIASRRPLSKHETTSSTKGGWQVRKPKSNFATPIQDLSKRSSL